MLFVQGISVIVVLLFAAGCYHRHHHRTSADREADTANGETHHGAVNAQQRPRVYVSSPYSLPPLPVSIGTSQPFPHLLHCRGQLNLTRDLRSATKPICNNKLKVDAAGNCPLHVMHRRICKINHYNPVKIDLVGTTKVPWQLNYNMSWASGLLRARMAARKTRTKPRYDLTAPFAALAPPRPESEGLPVWPTLPTSVVGGFVSVFMPKEQCHFTVMSVAFHPDNNIISFFGLFVLPMKKLPSEVKASFRETMRINIYPNIRVDSDPVWKSCNPKATSYSHHAPVFILRCPYDPIAHPLDRFHNVTIVVPLLNVELTVPVFPLDQLLAPKKLTLTPAGLLYEKLSRPSTHVVEWVEYHLMTGIERIYLMGSSPHLTELLWPYIEEGSVVIFPRTFWEFFNVDPLNRKYYFIEASYFFHEYWRDAHRLVMDTDEYIQCPVFDGLFNLSLLFDGTVPCARYCFNEEIFGKEAHENPSISWEEKLVIDKFAYVTRTNTKNQKRKCMFRPTDCNFASAHTCYI